MGIGRWFRNRKAMEMPKKWMLVNEFGDSKVLLDTSTVKRNGNFVCVDVLYDLNTCGTDKRNNKPVKQMINSEEYDLLSSTFRVHRIDFIYKDGRHGEPLITVPEWNEATAGNAKTLAVLRHLCAQI